MTMRDPEPLADQTGETEDQIAMCCGLLSCAKPLIQSAGSACAS